MSIVIIHMSYFSAIIVSNNNLFLNSWPCFHTFPSQSPMYEINQIRVFIVYSIEAIYNSYMLYCKEHAIYISIYFSNCNFWVRSLKCLTSFISTKSSKKQFCIRVENEKKVIISRLGSLSFQNNLVCFKAIKTNCYK